jgi:hypothetical protein
VPPHSCDPPLPCAEPELAAVCVLFAASGDSLTSPAAPKEALLRDLPTATHLLLAGHGYYDPEEPLAFHLALAGGERLTLTDLFDGHALRGARLVVASACQAAVTDMTWAQAWMRDATLRKPDTFTARVGPRRRTHARYAGHPSHRAPFVLVGDG